MAVNRFWNQGQQAQYSPMSMQELAYAPQIMYGRDQDLTAKVDAMNEASSTLKSMLGDKAGKSEQFDIGYKSILDKIATEGATPRNLQAAKDLRQMYIKEVLPQEVFAKKRESTMAGQMKDRANLNNIVVGPNAADISFDQYSKDPNAMQYQVAERDKLLQHGALIGKQYADSEDATKTHIDEFGKLVIQNGFATADEAMQAYESDPKFKQWVDSQAILATKASGLTNPNQDALDAIKSGIMTTVVGGIKRENLSDTELQRLRASGVQPTNGISVLSFEDKAIPVSASGETDYPVDMDIALKNPDVKKEYDKQLARISGNVFTSQAALQAEKDRIQNTNMDAYSQSGGMFTSPLRFQDPIKDRAERLKKLETIENTVKNNFLNAAGWTSNKSISLNNTNTAWLLPAEKTSLNDSMEGVAKDVEKWLPSWSTDKVTGYSPATKDDIKKLKAFTEEGGGKVEYADLQINGNIIGDKIVGTGQLTGLFKLKYKDPKKNDEYVSLTLPPQQEQNLFTPLEIIAARNNPAQADELNQYKNLHIEYLKNKAAVELDRYNKSNKK
jgi:hypothetical protein